MGVGVGVGVGQGGLTLAGSSRILKRYNPIIWSEGTPCVLIAIVSRISLHGGGVGEIKYR